MKLELTFSTLSGRTSAIFSHEEKAFDETLTKVWNFLNDEQAASSVDFPYEGVLVNAKIVR
jgi:hypothetical protein